MTILSITIAVGWFGVVLSFLSVSLYGYNLPEWQGIYSYFSYSTIPIGSFAVISFSWNLLFSKKNKNIAMGIVAVICIVYYITLYATWDTSVVVVASGDAVMEDWLSPTSIPYWLIWTLVGFGCLIWALGFGKFRKRSPGTLRKRANLLLLATFLVGGAILLDTVILMDASSSILFLPKLMMIPGLALGYLGLKPVE